MSRESILKLSEEKAKIEQEISSIVEFLTGPGMPGLKGSLVDSEGFPIAGVDLYQVRSNRQRYNMLNNDYTALMNKIEAELHSYFGNPEAARSSSNETRPSEEISVGFKDTPVPFAQITEVTFASPASEGGLAVGDKIVAFGTINYSNHDNLANLVEFIKANEGRQVKVLVNRENNDALYLSITPHKWQGNGILGCRFKSLN